MSEPAAAEPPQSPQGAGEVTVLPGRSLKQAVVTALVLVALIAGAYVIGVTAFFVLASAVVLLALFELLDAVKLKGGSPAVAAGLLGGAAFLVIAYAEAPRFFAVACIGTLVAVFFTALRPARGRTPMSDAAWTLLGVVWIGGGGAAAVLILRIDEIGMGLLVAFVLTTAVDDIAAYFVGTTFGRHKMAPSISPAKSWEGLAGGILGAVAGGVVSGLLIPELGALGGLGMGAVCAALAPAGDLVESMAKREIGIKDSGSLLPGHGGFLDRLDAIILCAPAVYLYLRLLPL